MSEPNAGVQGQLLFGTYPPFICSVHGTLGDGWQTFTLTVLVRLSTLKAFL
jgi:hypothetical protein